MSKKASRNGPTDASHEVSKDEPEDVTEGGTSKYTDEVIEKYIYDDSDERDLDSVWDIAEDLELYEDGFFYPICLGDVLDGRYLIVHKLGHGGFSTVWMAFDMKRAANVALKVSATARLKDPLSDEADIIAEIVRVMKDPSNLILPYRTFDLQGQDDNRHMVSVLPLLGPDVENGPQDRPTAIILSAIRKLLVVISRLHNAGFVHGDITVGNVMWGLHPGARQIPPMLCYKVFGKHRVQPIPYDTSKLGQLVAPCNIPANLLSDEFYLGDFGISIRADKVSLSSPENSISNTVALPALRYCAPELFHGKQPSPASDMWSFMVLFFKLYTRGGLPWSSPLGGGPADLAGFMCAINGPFPQIWKGQWSGGGKVDERWYDQTLAVNPRWSLEQHMKEKRPEASVTERHLFLVVARKAFCYEPSRRITAAQLLDDPDFNALLAYYDL